MTETRRGLAWEFGVLSVERRGAMLGPVLFTLPDGRQVAPLHVARWFAHPEAANLSGLMPRLRGDWACVPFGFDADREASGDWPASRAEDGLDEGHGFGANHDWRFTDGPSGTLALTIEYPASHPISHLERRIVPDPLAPAIELELVVHCRTDCELPVGLHPCIRLPEAVGAFEILLDADAEVATYPGAVDTTSIFAPNCFAKTSAVPLKMGGTLDIRRLPLLQQTEELVQVLQSPGAVTLVNHAEAYRVHLSWEAEAFPSLLLWISNRGRAHFPWDGRHLALGVEPVCAAFDLGTAIGRAPNPLNARGTPTAHAFRAGETWTTRHRIAVAPAGENLG
ncbi:hypothetical protein NGM99_10865 [Mesorhizobium sp. RP14(2022)]|jgi:hypothetical protein|uniref:Aldose 1-epimerase n=1 Tax=Mesorhizobium liriopis TaxID=2953882 RepID=A0ABT1C636_9HYPH|nr:hypothetical protein [Mesorhizobium liriopis]MCO6050284.1 hypothetical protein [Mesorhizobium liriopis]